ncbi:MAG TPA: cupin domain-containing protein [Xanthobacteraceae bacterium]|nr:cupin domain-containing protein [Xanthobacteraceae bacterium]
MTQEYDDHRRIVVVDEGDQSRTIADGPSPDIRTDPARPGFKLSRMWASEATPVRLKNLRESLHLPYTLEPPLTGSTCYMVTFPPDSVFRGKVGAREVAAYFASMGSPGASTYSPKAPHPYMQKTQSLEFALILKGEITLVLDLEEVHLRAGDIVVQRGTNHAWSNRSEEPCVIAFSAHGAVA